MFNTDILLTLHSELSIFNTWTPHEPPKRRKVVFYFNLDHYLKILLKETAIHIINKCLLFSFFMWHVDSSLKKKDSVFCWYYPCSLCTSLHTVQGGSYFSHSFHTTSFQLEEWFYMVYVLKSAEIILNFSECNCYHYRYIVSNKTWLFNPAITRAKASLNINYYPAWNGKGIKMWIT